MNLNAGLHKSQIKSRRLSSDNSELPPEYELLIIPSYPKHSPCEAYEMKPMQPIGLTEPTEHIRLMPFSM